MKKYLLILVLLLPFVLATGDDELLVSMIGDDELTVMYLAGDDELNLISVTTYPTITLISPENSSVWYGKDVTFKYSVVDDTTVNNCTLHFEGYTKIDTTITEATEQTFTQAEIPDGSYLWNVSCYDDENQITTSNNYLFTVIHSTVTSGAAGGGLTCPEGYELVDNHCVKIGLIKRAFKKTVKTLDEQKKKILFGIGIVAFGLFSYYLNKKEKKRVKSHS